VAGVGRASCISWRSPARAELAELPLCTTAAGTQCLSVHFGAADLPETSIKAPLHTIYNFIFCSNCWALSCSWTPNDGAGTEPCESDPSPGDAEASRRTGRNGTSSEELLLLLPASACGPVDFARDRGSLAIMSHKYWHEAETLLDGFPTFAAGEVYELMSKLR